MLQLISTELTVSRSFMEVRSDMNSFSKSESARLNITSPIIQTFKYGNIEEKWILLDVKERAQSRGCIRPIIDYIALLLLSTAQLWCQNGELWNASNFILIIENFYFSLLIKLVSNVSIKIEMTGLLSSTQALMYDFPW